MSSEAQIVVRHWTSHTRLPLHTHPFHVTAWMVSGEMWLTLADQESIHLLPGDTFSLKAHQPHSEIYGTQGATYWVARQSP